MEWFVKQRKKTDRQNETVAYTLMLFSNIYQKRKETEPEKWEKTNQKNIVFCLVLFGFVLGTSTFIHHHFGKIRLDDMSIRIEIDQRDR